ncbi:MAG: tetratricopeptide repeat protein [Desulfobacterales bacterium]|jgi:tetratricopeptide (TPR) repeat protein
MYRQIHISFCSKLTLAALILVFMICLAYMNTFQASWHLDDRPNIVKNSGLHITNLKIETLIRTFYTSPTRPGWIGKKLYRPIPCLTFAVNWYFGKDDVFGYHLVNLIVHVLTAFFLFLTVFFLLKSPNIGNKVRGNEVIIAFLTAALWAMNPIQTQAVTYIVQRMASMAAMFYILSMLFYIMCRLSENSIKRIFLLLGCFLAYLFALGSKENTIVLPAALVLIEILFFQNLSVPRTRRIWLRGSIAGGILLILMGALIFSSGYLVSIINGYHLRPFTLSERLLTEPRVVVFYLSQIFYAVPSRLSIEHDVQMSTSLFQPWSTLPAILAIFLMIALGFLLIRKQPMVSLAILFFFLNHVIESSIIPLELIFEHRNYLPSMFLFLPIAYGIVSMIEHYKQKNLALSRVLVIFSALLLVCFGSSTHIRNMAWATEKSLWEDAIKKAPNSNRPLHNLAWGYYVKIGRYDKALELYARSLDLQRNNNFSKSLALNNMALIYFHKKDVMRAIGLWKQALELNPDLEIIQFRYAIGLTEMGDFENALETINQLLSRRPHHLDYNYLKGRILLMKKDYNSALKYFEKCLELKPGSAEIMRNIEICRNMLGQFSLAESVLENALRNDPK